MSGRINFHFLFYSILIILSGGCHKSGVETSKDSKEEISPLLIRAEALKRNKPDSAYFYYSQALRICDNLNKAESKPEIFYRMALLNSEAGNYPLALNLLDSSIQFAGLYKDSATLSNCYNEYGNIKFAMGDNEGAKNMFQQVYRIAKSNNLYKQWGSSLGNLALHESDQEKSIKMLKEGISVLKKGQDCEPEMAYIYVNLGYYFTNPDSAIFYFNKALEYAGKGHSDETLIAAYNNLAYAYLDKKDVEKAVYLLKNEAIPLAVKDRNLNWLSKLYDSYADLMKFKMDYKAASEFQDSAYKNRSLADLDQASSQTRLLISILDLKNKEIQIQSKEVKIRSMRLNLILLLLLIFILLILAALIITILRFRNQKTKTEMTRRMIRLSENEKTRISSELHDLIGPVNTLLNSHLERAQQAETVTSTASREELTVLTSRIRQLSHLLNTNLIRRRTFHSLLLGLQRSFQIFPELRIELELPDEEIKMEGDLLNHAYFISLELLNNAVKHVKSGCISLKATEESGKLNILYKDEGPGFEKGTIRDNGLGIMNIYDRVALLNGKATLDSSPQFGTSWTIVIPLHKRKQPLKR